MHLLERGACRAVQAALRLVMPVLPYRAPKLLCSTAEVPAELAAKGVDSVLLVTDAALEAMGMTHALEQALAEEGIRCAVYSGTVSNPTVQNVEEARALYLAEDCKALIGFGGGSAIDCAKAVGARIARPGCPLSRMRGVLRVLRKLPPLIAIPTTAATRADALEAVRLIFAHLETAYRDGEDTRAREGMMTAAFLAGRAFSKSYVGYVHAVAHSLGGRYGTPHGLANAVLLPILLEAYGPCIRPQLHQLAVAAGLAREEDDPADSADRFLRAVRALNRRMEIPETLADIRPQDIPLLARYAAQEANPLYPVPRLMDAEELETFYYKAAERLTIKCQP